MRVAVARAGCDFDLDERPRGGHDLLTFAHDMSGASTTLTRIQIVEGTCRRTSKAVPGWACEGPPGTFCPVASDYPPRD